MITRGLFNNRSSRIVSGLFAAVLILSLAGCKLGPPIDWYVAVTGSDTKDCRTLATACRTVGAAIVKAGDGDIIHIAAGTYMENLVITEDLTFIGEGAGKTILDGNGAITGKRVIDISCWACGELVVTISGLTIQNGKPSGVTGGGGLSVVAAIVRLSDIVVKGNSAAYGGGIYISQSGKIKSTLDNVTVVGNTAEQNGGGIYIDIGPVTLNRVSVLENEAGKGNGGGIYNAPSGVLTVTESTIASNNAYLYGGGLYNKSGTVSMQRSAVHSNTATAGGGMMNLGNNAKMTLINVTIGDNHAGQAGGVGNGELSESSTLNIMNATIASNGAQAGGGLYYRSGTINISNSILAYNNGGNCTSGQIGSYTGNYNLSNDGTCSFFHGFSPEGSLNNTDPKLGPLQNNGGTTLTYALLPGSPAIDAGTAQGAPNVDQRGSPRPVDGDFDSNPQYDIGAYEFSTSPLDLQATLALPSAAPTSVIFTPNVTANCRSGPDSAYGIAAFLTSGTPVTAEARNSDGLWLYIPIGEQRCWVAVSNGTLTGDVSGLPVREAPPLPTATNIPACHDYPDESTCVSDPNQVGGCSWSADRHSCVP